MALRSLDGAFPLVRPTCPTADPSLPSGREQIDSAIVLNQRVQFLDSTPAAQSSRGASERGARPIIEYGDLNVRLNGDDCPPSMPSHIIG